MECGCSDDSDDACSITRISELEEVDSKEVEEKLSPMSDCNQEDSSNELDVDVETEFNENPEAASEKNEPSRTFQTPQIVMQPVIRKNSVLRKLSTPAVSAIQPVSSRFHSTLTSTPAPVSFFNDVLTPSPFHGSNEDMSPITMSAKKMPKSMQVCARYCACLAWGCMMDA